MNVYRWYTEALCVSGTTCARNIDIAKDQILGYLKKVFPWKDEDLHKKGYEDIELQIWSIEEDEAYSSNHPLTIATNY